MRRFGSLLRRFARFQQSHSRAGWPCPSSSLWERAYPLRRPDLNRRPEDYESSELPDCSTPRSTVYHVDTLHIVVAPWEFSSDHKPLKIRSAFDLHTPKMLRFHHPEFSPFCNAKRKLHCVDGARLLKLGDIILLIHPWRLRPHIESAYQDVVRTEQPQKGLAIRWIPSILPHSKSTRSSVIEWASKRRALFHEEIIFRPRHASFISPFIVTAIEGKFTSVIFCAPQPGQLRRPHDVAEVLHGSDAVHYMPRLNALRSGGTVTLNPFLRALTTVSQRNSRCESSASSGQSISKARNEPWNSWAGDSITAFMADKCSTYEV
jgi:hypothetical protein